jgi:hypothetical protein
MVSLKTIITVIAAVAGSPEESEVGVREAKSGRKGVLEGGLNAARSPAEAAFDDPGIDPLMSEHPKIKAAAAIQKILGIPPKVFMARFS